MSSAPTIDLRIVRDDGVILVERTLAVDTGHALVDAMAMGDADLAEAALAAGYGIRLELRDPDGDVGPAGEWLVVDRREP